MVNTFADSTIRSRTSADIRDRVARWTAPIWLILLPILMKLPLILGVWLPDPALRYSGLASGLVRGSLANHQPFPTIDPNQGFTSQALGHLAAMDVLSGHWPWWNPFEGVGAPLAGEMQSAALFPLTWLLALPNGQLYEQLALQMIAGLATLCLLRKLGVGWVAAMTGAILFQFNGVFAWLSNAIVNPVPFLPVTLLGLEMASERARAGRVGGGILIALGLALSLYAGFPEIAYLDGLLAGAWALLAAVLMGPAARPKFIVTVFASGIAALLIAAPQLIAFADYLEVAQLGLHDGAGFEHARWNPGYMAFIGIPYIFGGIFSAPEYNDFWGNTGGYAGCGLVILALTGTGSRGAPRQPLRLMLWCWIIIAIGLQFSAPWAPWIIHNMPGFKQIPLFRYLNASWICALCILAAFAVDDLGRRGATTQMRIACSVSIALGIVGLGIMHRHRLSPSSDLIALAGDAIALLTVQAFVLAATWPTMTSLRRSRTVAFAACAEAMVWFAIPLASYPRAGSLNVASVAFLKDHLGTQRFFTLGPIAANYGSYFGIGSINHNDIPVPAAWFDRIHSDLDPNADAISFDGVTRVDPSGPSAMESLIRHPAGYDAVGVKYVVTQPTQDLPGSRLAYADDLVKIFERDEAAPYIAAAGCELRGHSRVTLTAKCERDSTLNRLELWMPGWRAWIDGAETPVVRTEWSTQAIPLPKGESSIEFEFRPPYMRVGYAAFLVGWGLALWRR